MAGQEYERVHAVHNEQPDSSFVLLGSCPHQNRSLPYDFPVGLAGLERQNTHPPQSDLPAQSLALHCQSRSVYGPLRCVWRQKYRMILSQDVNEEHWAPMRDADEG